MTDADPTPPTPPSDPVQNTVPQAAPEMPPPPPPPEPVPEQGPSPSGDTELRKWSMWLHLSGLLSYILTATPLIGLVAPIVIWMMKKDVLPGIEPHGKNAVNFHISLLVYALGLTVLGTIITFITFGLGAFLVFPLAVLAGIAIFVAGLVFPILAGIAANKGQVYRYPLTIDFFKLFAKAQQSGS